MERDDWSEIERFVEIGSVLNEKYRIERLLGVGGMGAVVAAEHLKLGESVAIKFLLPRAMGQGRRTQRFLREARAVSKMRSAHVARVFDVDVRADGAPFIVMEHLAGETLRTRIKRDGPLEVARTVDDMLEACEAVAEAHSRGVVHRDLKPANLFLARGVGDVEVVKVLDFGISKLVAPDSNDTESTTGEGFVGSPPYMSPEQLTDPTRIDLRTDIWSIGVILYECLTGKAPFKAEAVGQVLAAILQGRPQAISELRSDVMQGLAKIVERCMSKERDARYPDVVALARDLASHGTDRGRRTLTVIEAISAGRHERVAPARSSDTWPTPSGAGIDTGTLSAALGAEVRPVATRRAAGPRVGLLAIALGAIVGVVFLVQKLRVPENPSRGAATTDGAVMPEEAMEAPAPPPAPTHPIASARPIASEPSAAPLSSAKPKARTVRAPAPAASASASPRGFDPVFDERR